MAARVAELREDAAAYELAADESTSELDAHVPVGFVDNTEMVPVEQVPNILKGEGLACTVDEVIDALEHIRMRNNSDNADLSTMTSAEVTAVFQFLSESAGHSNAVYVENAGQAERAAGIARYIPGSVTRFVERMRLKFRRSKAQGDMVYDSGMKPSNRLLLIVVLLSLLMALTVAGTAIGLIWTNAMESERSALKEDLSMIKNAIEFFSITNARKRQEQNQMDTAFIISDILREVGYNQNLKTDGEGQLNAVQTSSILIENMFHEHVDSYTRTSVKLLMNIFEFLYANASAPQQLIIDMANTVNSLQLQRGREIVLGRNSSAARGYDFLTNLTFKSICKNGVCGSDPTAAIPMRRALMGINDAAKVYDYVPQLVYGGYGYLPTLNMGLVYKTQFFVLQEEFQTDIATTLNSLNSNFTDTSELILLTNGSNGTTGNPTYFSTLRFQSQCGAKCKFPSQTFLGATLTSNATTASYDSIDYRGVNVLASYAPMYELGASLVLKVDMQDVKEEMIQQIGNATSTINNGLTGTTELLIGRKVVYNDSYSWFKQVSTRKFTNECVGPCGTAPGAAQPMIMAVVQCVNGYVTTLDYRSKLVVAGVACIPELGVGIVLKIDVAEMNNASIQEVIEYANTQNIIQPGSLELMVARRVPGVSPVRSKADLVVLTELANDNKSCNVPGTCWGPGTSAGPLVEAINGNEGYSQFQDYHPLRALAAYTNLKDLDLGLVLKIDMSEIEEPMYISLYILLGTAIGIVIIGVLVLAFSAQKMLKSMMDTWERGKAAVQQQKENFENLVAALYPKFATDRLLAGDQQIVLEVPQATILFSDIHGFTSTSNIISANELVEWMAYTFSVMDGVAEYYKIYKVKTIGDAYFAIAGLPGIVSDGEDDNHTMRMLNFASVCAQVFSERYIHPDAGTCLQRITALASSLNKGKGEKADKARKANREQSTTSSSTRLSATGSETSQIQNSATCMMRYGLSVGPVTAGVLHGKCPAFDIWGATVNLAARMKATGTPCRIHCSDGVYRKISADSASPYVWEKPHTTFAKGFGNVQTYFVKGTHNSPPKELLIALMLEPHLGYFSFEAQGAPVAGGKAPARGGANPDSYVPSEQGEKRRPGSVASSSTGAPLNMVPVDGSSSEVDEPPPNPAPLAKHMSSKSMGANRGQVPPVSSGPNLGNSGTNASPSVNVVTFYPVPKPSTPSQSNNNILAPAQLRT